MTFDTVPGSGDGERQLEAMTTPALIVDRDKLERNIDRMASRAKAAGVRLWPHVKTHKSQAIAELQRNAGAEGHTVATVAEAETLADAGFDDLLVAYPPVGPWRMARLIEVARRVRVRVALGDPRTLEELDRACAAAKVEIGWLWEIDCGARRIGTAPGSPTTELVASLVPRFKAAPFEGLFTFAGHAYQARDLEDLAQIAAFEQASVIETAEELAGLGLDVATLSIGTTPTSHLLGKGLDPRLEVRPGNYVFYDATQVGLGLVEPSACALSVLSTVVSRPAPDRMILDAGSKALAAERLNDQTVGFGIVEGHPELLIERLFEEHAIVVSESEVEIPLGARVRLIPNHACATVNLHQRMNVVDGDAVVDEWQIGPRRWDPVDQPSIDLHPEAARRHE
jgi:D-serine deaminase-like pyridoxal phosphate-dependent protein